MFNFGVILVLSTQHMTIVNNILRRSRSVNNSCDMTPKSKRKHINTVFEHFLFEASQNTSLRGVLGGSECGNRMSGASFCVVFRSNYGSILQHSSIRVMTMGRTTDGNCPGGEMSGRMCRGGCPDPVLNIILCAVQSVWF